MENGILFSSYVGHLFNLEFHLLFAFWFRFQFSSFVQINIYVRLPFPLVLSCSIRLFLFCLRQRRIPYTVYGLGWYIKHIGILLVRCGTHICQCQSSNRIHSRKT
uniref:hypothetical protein n=1 Tax=Jatropha curcas TaxID=180498 RepID=UPI0027AB5F0E|nr:hypothetical protein QLP06_mgp064 [Jatropha curcas]WFG81175.1 hypothetical protein [Jatropha curcas]